MRSLRKLTRVCYAYLAAKEIVVQSGYAREIEWQASVDFEHLTESRFLHEFAWVTLSAGMNEKVIRGVFTPISSAFRGFESAKLVVSNRKECQRSALLVFSHKKKIESILWLCDYIERCGFDYLKRELHKFGVDYLCQFPYMGPATSRHLAKNIGINCEKPDRHLIRIAEALGYQDPASLCKSISDVVGDPVCVVDIIIWRFATLDSSYLDFFRAPFGLDPSANVPLTKARINYVGASVVSPSFPYNSEVY